MVGSSWNGVLIRYSVNNIYRVDTYNTVEKSGIKYHSAIVLKKDRAYWRPVLHGINLLDNELEKYYTEQFV